MTFIGNKPIVIFSVLLSKDLLTGAVGNGRLFPHFFGSKKPEGELDQQLHESSIDQPQMLDR
ncbi:hypothetical protein [Microcoleus sp. LEGE 07076]|uniref:hypothetical protein n=1 Tax=Microcoleus sp. LEGE 07076 TaxID=915322 RepID=UPI00187E6730|nr:hypothetical protein [Microcoleus sp. LEGE 07076]